MSIGNFRAADPLGFQNLDDEVARLRLHRLNLSRRPGAGGASGQSATTVSQQLQQVDWKATLERTGNFEAVLELSSEIAKRGAGIMAFQRSAYKILRDEVGKNRSGNHRGLVVSVRWRKLYEGLGNFGEVLSLSGIPMKAAELSWKDLSAKAVSANLMTTMAQWGTESAALGPVRTVQAGAEVVGWVAGGLGFRDAATEIKTFAIGLEGTINNAQEVIDKTLSVANARDVLTWDRSVINPDNWSLLQDGVRDYFDGLAAGAQPLYDAVVDSIGTRRRH